MREPVRKAERVEPTLQTVLKARTHAVTTLPPEFQLAAIAIETGYQVIVRGLMPRAASLAPKTGGGPRDLSEDEGKAAALYTAWAKEMGARKWPLDLVIEVVVDGIHPEQIDRRYGRKPFDEPWAAERLIEALLLFNKMRDMP